MRNTFTATRATSMTYAATNYTLYIPTNIRNIINIPELIYTYILRAPSRISRTSRLHVSLSTRARIRQAFSKLFRLLVLLILDLRSEISILFAHWLRGVFLLPLMRELGCLLLEEEKRRLTNF